jgi:hypothetical protein
MIRRLSLMVLLALLLGVLQKLFASFSDFW